MVDGQVEWINGEGEGEGEGDWERNKKESRMVVMRCDV